MAAETLKDSLAVFNCGTAVAGGGDNDMGAARWKTYEDLDTDGALADTSKEHIFVLECRARHQSTHLSD